MFTRLIQKSFLQAVKTFPVVILTGARQTGKSTLCKSLLKKTHAYVSLEDPDLRRQAIEDPRTFLKNFPPPVIFDEIQYAPELPSYIQGIVDENRTRYGQYILTGSQNFLLMKQVSQSLAGRAALLTLHTCSTVEIYPKKTLSEPKDVADWILRGAYPEMRARKNLNRETWCSSYIQLYLDRDVRQLSQIGDLRTFERFVRLTAIRTGQILNVSDLARDAGVSTVTANRWLSVLEASYQIFLLQPFHANLSKRLIKAPKLYFRDTALATYLMGIHDSETLMKGLSFGPLFETAVVLEHIKRNSFTTNPLVLNYFRTKDGTEADLLVQDGNDLTAKEIKTSRTLNPSLADNLIKVEKILGRPIKKELLAPVPKSTILSKGVVVKPWNQA
ncbi:MAG: ATP-binding protein [Candidatus Gracilibacteria bacterium]|jgi:hypothetical protein